jgi:chromosome segregation ATPase
MPGGHTVLSERKQKEEARSAKKNYDVRYPVLPVRVPAVLKERLSSEAASKGMMLSEYTRKLLMELEVRERTVEKVVEKPVVKTVQDPEKDKMIGRQKRTIKKLRLLLSRYRKDKTELSKRLRASEDEVKELKDSLSSMSVEGDVQLRKVVELRNEVNTLSGDKERLERQMEWALSELKSNDERNREIAIQIAKKNGIQVRFVTAEWGEMP